MTSKRKLLTIVVPVALAGLLAATTHVGALPSPQAGHLLITNAMTSTSGECVGNVAVQYGMNTVNYPLDINVHRTSSCAAEVSVNWNTSSGSPTLWAGHSYVTNCASHWARTLGFACANYMDYVVIATVDQNLIGCHGFINFYGASQPNGRMSSMRESSMIVDPCSGSFWDIIWQDYSYVGTYDVIWYQDTGFHAGAVCSASIEYFSCVITPGQVEFPGTTFSTTLQSIPSVPAGSAMDVPLIQPT